MKRASIISAAVTFLCWTYDIRAQSPTGAQSPSSTNVELAPKINQASQIPAATQAEKLGNELFHSDREIWLSFSILIFGFLFLILVTISLFKLSQNPGPEDLIKTYMIGVIIVGVLFMISAGWSNDQIAPATGLFGSIVGYLSDVVKVGAINPLNRPQIHKRDRE